MGILFDNSPEVPPTLSLREQKKAETQARREAQRNQKRSARHSADNPNWTTPAEWIERGRAVLGGHIELDPFSTLRANEVVGAERIFTPEDDAFTKQWIAKTASINPPGLQVAEAWRKAMLEVREGRLKRFYWVGFSVEQLCLLADPLDPDAESVACDVDELRAAQMRFAAGRAHPMDFSCVVLRKRISFEREADRSTGSPSHGNFLTGVNVDHSLFKRVLSPFGRVFRGALAVDQVAA